MLKDIAFVFPHDKKTDFYDFLILLLEKLPNSKKEDKEIVITPSSPSDALPTTSFKQADILFPQLHLAIENKLILKAGSFYVLSGDGHPIEYTPVLATFNETVLEDRQGKYVELRINGENYYQLFMLELYRRLSSHIVRIDHTGINIPSSLVSKTSWSNFLQIVSKESNLYRYPTGEDWPFILPATHDEFRSDIAEFPKGREPKFELVYEVYSPVPVLQFDIETDLTRAQVEELLPEPYGISFPNLAEYFRTVYISHPWRGISIRFDIRFKNSDTIGDWKTGEWLVKDGGRIT